MSQRQSVRQHTTIDLVKFICALLVVIIHTSPLENVSKSGHFILVNILARVAVPLFFSISGFLLFGKLNYCSGKISKDGDNLNKLLSYCKRNTALYLAWSTIYLVAVNLPKWYCIGWWGIHVVKDMLFSLVFEGMYYHLWYLLAMIYAVPLLYILLRLLPIQQVCWIAVVLWIFECLTYSYTWIGVDQLPIVTFIISRTPGVFTATFRAVPLLTVGAVIALNPPKWSRKRTCFLGTISLLFYVTEATMLYMFSPNKEAFSYLFSTPLLAFNWMFFITQVQSKWLTETCARMLRDMSLIIYCIHPLVIEAVNTLKISSGIIKWLAVTILSVAVATACALLRICNHKNRSLKR